MNIENGSQLYADDEFKCPADANHVDQSNAFPGNVQLGDLLRKTGGIVLCMIVGDCGRYFVGI